LRSPTSTTVTGRSRAIHREYLQLTVLVAVAVAAFFVTRAVAANNHQMNVRDAAEWYDRGQRRLSSGDVAGAVDAFRRATVKNRNDRPYVLAFARALAANGQHALARSALLSLRETTPEDPEVNLQLARLAAAQGDIGDAVGYYRSALYAPWAPEQLEARRAVRLELIRFLLSHGDKSRALPELLAASTDTNPTAAAHVQIAQLFVAAGDPRRALDQFAAALALDPQNADALAGAGEAAFTIGDYERARRYLHAAPRGVDSVEASRQLVDLVLENDPLGRRIGSAARRRRTIENVTYAVDRLNGCAASKATPAANSPLALLQQEANAFTRNLKPPALADTDTVEAAIDLVQRIEKVAIAECPPATARDRALILIGSRHGADE
jgi:tetratricopeptide (TPR) repeat protein